MCVSRFSRNRTAFSPILKEGERAPLNQSPHPPQEPLQAEDGDKGAKKGPKEPRESGAAPIGPQIGLGPALGRRGLRQVLEEVRQLFGAVELAAAGVGQFLEEVVVGFAPA